MVGWKRCARRRRLFRRGRRPRIRWRRTAAAPAPAPAEIGHEPTIGKIERVPLREVWRHEAYDLTTWLEENIDVLNDALDANLSNVEREHAAGSFSVDLIAEDDSGGIAVIEDQLERSNHDHLGKWMASAAWLQSQSPERWGAVPPLPDPWDIVDQWVG